MYLGLVLLLVAWALWLGTLSPWLVPPLFALFLARANIALEEQALEKVFAEAYLAYKRSVRRWIGRH
jgi:protein-S-isoprenylcysteine O-methyltransferase Ste14